MTDSHNFFFFYFDLVLAILFLYSAWVNLVRKRISKYGVDTFIFRLYNLMAKEKVEKLQLRENPQFIGRMGLLTLILGFSFLNAAMEEIRAIWPYL